MFTLGRLCPGVSFYALRFLTGKNRTEGTRVQQCDGEEKEIKNFIERFNLKETNLK